ncbi:hypothetical protein ASPZODRAFT_141469 [Penicilliopsis zonata CBS 506.65]|uniref:Extracellular membrane protein CFEM domain-containing protein n=1 Tax=Penicilliopsis zonata CBS 506.65 TaxID=1073090 RepID=A0A1L9SLB6_9EURO|nr:hypothetical protein ASPZODRAFT_141469 [Penicilliopsis zonata CBS 506.65]OJJ47911.1 hypothetical protein ASPZODRAFT_141469 [Penicilliopsis zonata CBS 506.65]
MKFNLIALASLAALAVAQDATTSGATSTSSLSPEASCAAKCDNDVCCTAQCYHVPCPNGEMANNTNQCVAACPQGSGTPSDTQKYIDCQSRCFASDFFPATEPGAKSTATATDAGTATAVVKDTSATATGNGKSEKDSASTSSDSSSSTATSTASSSSTSQTGAASQVQLGASAAGLFGLVLAAFVL